VGCSYREFISFDIFVSDDVFYGEASKKCSILLTRDRYFLRVGSLAMHSFSICPAATLESVRRMHL
jgi:hypothetical protein